MQINNPIFKWMASFSVEPGLQSSEDVEGYHFAVQNDGQTLVDRIYETFAYDEMHPESINREYAEQTYYRQDAKKIREILLKRMAYQRVFSRIQIVFKSPPTLINRACLKEAGINLRRRVANEFIVRVPILDVGNTIFESESFWTESFSGRAKGQESEVIRIADWLERSEKEDDCIKSFILLWIGFNGLYGLYSKINHPNRQSDADKFKRMTRALVTSNQAKQIIKHHKKEIGELENYGVLSDKGNTNWSRNLREKMQNSDANSLLVLVLILKCVYGVRKQVFHEAPRTNDVIERVKVSKAILLPIAAVCLKAFTNH